MALALTLTHPSTCDINKGPCGPFVLKANQSQPVNFVCLAFFIGDAFVGVTFSLNGQDIFTSPFSVNIDFRTLIGANSCEPGLPLDTPFPLPGPNGAETVSVSALIFFPDTALVPVNAVSPDMIVTNNVIVLTSPGSCTSQDLCTGFKAQSIVPLTLLRGTLLLCKKGTPICDLVANDFSATGGIPLQNGWTPSLVFNNIDPTGLVVPPCGGSVTITPMWQLTLSTGIVTLEGPDFVLTSGNCTQVVMENVSTTQDVIGPCVGVRGTIGIDGVLDTVGTLGLLTTFENQPVHFGLIDPATGTFYQYVLSNTSVTSGLLSPGGRFGASFGIQNRADVVALIPPDGTRSMQLAAIYEGDDTHTQVMATKQITVQGENVTKPCFSGTLIAQKVFNSLPADVTEVHQLITVFTTSIIPQNLESEAQGLLDKTAAAITNSGATPLDVLVYRGPDVPLLTIFGLTVGTVPTLIVLAHAFGSPVAALLLVLAIVAALIVLGIIVYFISQQWANIATSAFKFCQQNPQLCAAAINVAEILAVAAVIGVAGIVGFFAYREIRKGRG